ETMPVFALGFPFGELLDPKKGNPAITVANSTASSLRLDERGELAKVQVAGGLNPGNSGGPMVDARGRLVGVAVAKVRGAEIGLAIPAQQVTKLLGGRVANLGVAPLKTENGVSTIQVEARVLDPLQQLRSVAVYYLHGNVGAQAKADLTAQAGVQKADL